MVPPHLEVALVHHLTPNQANQNRSHPVRGRSCILTQVNHQKAQKAINTADAIFTRKTMKLLIFGNVNYTPQQVIVVAGNQRDQVVAVDRLPNPLAAVDLKVLHILTLKAVKAANTAGEIFTQRTMKLKTFGNVNFTLQQVIVVAENRRDQVAAVDRLPNPEVGVDLLPNPVVAVHHPLNLEVAVDLEVPHILTPTRLRRVVNIADGILT